MGRFSQHPACKHLKFDVEKGQSVCQIGGRPTRLSGQHAANLEHHVQRNHHTECQAPAPEKPLCRKSLQWSGSEQVLRLGTGNEMKQTKLSHKVDSSAGVSANITGEAVTNACIELVTTNGRPFSMIDDCGFRKIIDHRTSTAHFHLCRRCCAVVHKAQGQQGDRARRDATHPNCIVARLHISAWACHPQEQWHCCAPPHDRTSEQNTAPHPLW